MPRPMRRLAQAFNHGVPFVLSRRLAPCGAAHHLHLEKEWGRQCRGWLRVGAGHRLGVVVALVCFACFAALFACLVCCFVLAFGCLCPCWASLPCYNWHPVLVRVWPAEGTTLPLGLGGLNNLFLLVGLGLFILSRNTVSNPFAYNIGVIHICTCIFHHISDLCLGRPLLSPGSRRALAWWKRQEPSWTAWGIL